MVVDNTVDTQAIAVRLSRLFERDDGVVEIRTLTQPERLLVWMITKPTDLDTERRIVRAWMPLYDEFPDHDIDLRLLNPSHFPVNVDVRDALPAEAKRVSPS